MSEPILNKSCGSGFPVKGGNAVVLRVLRTLVAALMVGQLLGLPLEAQVQGDDFCGTYEYTYPHNTEQLNENHYIVLECEGERIQGWYFGTSDDFDRGREGYLPGFFVVEMAELEFSRDSIHFTLEVSEEDFFSSPIPLHYRDAQQLTGEGFVRWRNRALMDRRQFRGLLHPDSIVLAVDGGKRVFSRAGKE